MRSGSDDDAGVQIVPVERSAPRRQGVRPAPEDLLPPVPAARSGTDGSNERVPAWCKQLIRTGWPPSNRYPSRSEADAAVCRVLVDAGSEDDEIYAIFHRHPQGIGARMYERGFEYLRRTVEFVRDEEPDTPVVRVVGGQVPSASGGRVQIDLEVLSGERHGERFQQGVSSASTAWPWLFRSAGLPVPPSGAVRAAHRLLRRTMRVRLRTWEGGMEVDRWLPTT